MAETDDTSDAVELAMTAGLPYARRARVEGGALIWPSLDDFEVQSEIRSAKKNGTLLGALVNYITPSIDGDDIVLDIRLTGAQTRLVPVKGYFDVILSDPGPEDARAIPALSGKIKVGTLVTGVPDA